MAEFIVAEPEISPANVPFFEDSQQLDIPGRGLEKSLPYYQANVVEMLARLHGAGVRFTEGHFPGASRRYGYRITFSAYGNTARIDCAALPLRKETPKKKDRALAQALYILAHKLEAMVHSYIYEPDSLPLVPYIMSPENGKTITEAIREYHRLALPERTS